MSHEFGGKVLHEFAEWGWRVDEDGDVFVRRELGMWNVYPMCNSCQQRDHFVHKAGLPYTSVADYEGVAVL